jgi:hypothetical protein
MFFVRNLLGGTSPHLQPVHKKNKESFLTEIAKNAMPQIMNLDSGKKRSSTFRSFGRKILESGKKYRNVNWRQFALMHNSSIIRETSFAGGEITASIDAWKEIFDMWENGDGLYFSFNLSQQQLKETSKALKVRRQYQKQV